MQSIENPPDPRRWGSLVVVLAATFMAILDTFVVNVAIPSIQRNLQSSFAQVELVIAAYTLVYAVMLITGGRLGDLFGRKRMFQIGLSSFTLISFLCGIAPNINILIALRILQGFAASLMMPQVIALIQLNFVARERGAALGFYGATVGIASIAGQIVGGLLISSNVFNLGWRNVFIVNVPIGIITVIATFLLIRETERSQSHKLDLVGVGLLTTGLALFTYPLIEGHDTRWPLWTIACLILSVPVIVSFVLYEQHLTKSGGAPLIPLTLFQQRSFNLGLLTALTYYSENGALFFTLALYLQFGLGFSPLEAGLTFVPLGTGFFIGSLGAPRLIPYLGTRVLLGGVIIMGLGEIWTILTIQQAGFVVPQNQLLLPLFVVGLGEGIIAAPLMTIVLTGIKSQNAGAVSGILTTAIQISQAIGVATIGVIFFTKLGQTTPTRSLRLAPVYGQAFVASLFAIAALAVITLIFVSLLPSPEQKGDESSSKGIDQQYGGSFTHQDGKWLPRRLLCSDRKQRVTGEDYGSIGQGFLLYP